MYPGLDILRWMDGQLAILRGGLNIIQVISGRWEEDNIKLCAMEPVLEVHIYYLYQVREGS